MTRAAEALIDLKALSHNFHRVRESAPDSRVLAVIKANGYGHGLKRVARALGEAEAFGVASIDEALVLRKAGIEQRILLLAGFSDREELDLAEQHDLSCVVHHDYQVALLEDAKLKRPRRVWLKIDTGMHRLGFRPEQAASYYDRLSQCRDSVADVTLMTHLANADQRDDDTSLSQIESFHDAVVGIRADQSIANSAGILGWPQSHFHDRPTWVRPGIMLYGASPFSDGHAAEHELRPVMTLRSRLIAINHFQKGQAIGYGGSWHCPENMPIGVVAIGYGDGYPRHARAGTPVLVDGHRVPLVGRVSMDMLTVDLRNHLNAQIGDEVVLWGHGLPVEDVARSADTIAYELLCRVSSRVTINEG